MNKENEQDSFKEFETLLLKIESSGLRKMDSDELLAFGHLYRRAVSALSMARSQQLNDNHITYLNQLVSRAYGHIYITESKGWPSVRRFFTIDFPQSFRRNLLYILVAFSIAFIAAGFAYGVVTNDVGKADVILGADASAMIDEIADRYTGDKDWLPGSERPMASSFIMRNNIKVSAMAFAGGITAGIITFIVLFQNGLMLGVIGAAIKARGPEIASGFWSFVAPHGVIELTAIFISGGAGLMLAWALLNPGEYTRGTALKLAGREAFKLILGVIAMLVVAGVIEGFFSPSRLPNDFKLLMALLLGVVEFSYLFLAGRETKARNEG